MAQGILPRTHGYPAEENSVYTQHASVLFPNLLFLVYYNFANFHNIIFIMWFGGFTIPNTMGDSSCHLHSSRFPCLQRLASYWEFLAWKLHNYGDHNNIPHLDEAIYSPWYNTVGVKCMSNCFVKILLEKLSGTKLQWRKRVWHMLPLIYKLWTIFELLHSNTIYQLLKCCSRKCYSK